MSQRVDGGLKVTGQMVYTGDISLPGMLHVAVLRSPYAHARIRRIETETAGRMPGVHCVLTGEDLPDVRSGRLIQDVPALAVGKVRFIGERVAAVAAETMAQAEAAAAAVRVDYEPLPAVFDPEEALQAGAPAVHTEPWGYRGAAVPPGGPVNLQAREVWSGGLDVEAALAAADLRFEERFATPSSHQGYLEPHVCIAEPLPGGRVRLLASTKSPFRLRSQVAEALGLPEQQIEVQAPVVGGDFGGKGSPMDAPLCAELARRTGRPVRVRMRYAEELMAANPRHASVITVRAGVSRDGLLQALDVRFLFNVGAYAGFRPLINIHGASEAGAPYRIPAIRIESQCVYTNQVPGGHKRAPGAVQTTFAIESMISLIADRLGADPVEIRRRNLLRTGEATALGEDFPEARGTETLDLALSAFRPVPLDPQEGPSVRYGRGIAVYCRTTRMGATSLRLRADRAGRLLAGAPQPEQGAGVHTVVHTVLAQEFALAPERVIVSYAGTETELYDDGVGSSKATAGAAEAASRAAVLLRQRARALAAAALGVMEPAVVEYHGPCWGRRGSGHRLTLGELAARAEESGRELSVTATVERSRGHGEGVLGFCVQIAQVGVDTETGQVFVYEVLTAHDVAAIINPGPHRVQIEGGVAFGLGEALLEDLAVRDGKVEAANLGDFKLPSMRDVPPVRVVYLPGGKGLGINNVKGIGEVSNVAVPAAIANAVADAVGVRITSLPVTAEKIYFALRQGRGEGGRQWESR